MQIHKMEKYERTMLLRDEKLKAMAKRQNYISQRKLQAIEDKKSYKDLYQSDISKFEDEAKKLEQ